MVEAGATFHDEELPYDADTHRAWELSKENYQNALNPLLPSIHREILNYYYLKIDRKVPGLLGAYFIPRRFKAKTYLPLKRTERAKIHKYDLREEYLSSLYEFLMQLETGDTLRLYGLWFGDGTYCDVVLGSKRNKMLCFEVDDNYYDYGTIYDDVWKLGVGESAYIFTPVNDLAPITSRLQVGSEWSVR